MFLHLKIFFLSLFTITEQVKFDFDKPAVQVITRYKDIFMPGLNGKPQLGTSSATCWARGGVCVHIRECPSMDFDSGVFGCTQRYKVCCRKIRPLSPTVGIKRASDILTGAEESDSVESGQESKMLMFLIS
ncbi:unnamed protein product [Colias eurytheme]|nr:unnamed protein product [Colias eurytheme]